MDNANTQTDFGQPSAAARTIEQICLDAGIKVATVQKACVRANLSVKFDKSLPPTEEQIQASAALRRALRGVAASKKPSSTAAPKTPAEKAKKAAPAVIREILPLAKKALQWTRCKAGLLVIMAGTMVVSWQNMYAVTGELFAERSTASLTLTGMLCLSPFVFSLAGMVEGKRKVLVVALGLFEAFCNTSRIYGGLTNFDNPNPLHMGCPTRFLGLVCDLLGSGTIYTAKALSVLLSGLILWLFYTAIFGLKK